MAEARGQSGIFLDQEHVSLAALGRALGKKTHMLDAFEADHRLLAPFNHCHQTNIGGSTGFNALAFPLNPGTAGKECKRLRRRVGYRSICPICGSTGPTHR